MAKNVSYTTEQEKTIIAAMEGVTTYDEQANVLAELQKKFGKSIPSLRSKLGQMGLYIKKENPKGKGKRGETKEELISKLADRFPDKQDGFFDSLATATKPVIRWVLEVSAKDDED